MSLNIYLDTYLTLQLSAVSNGQQILDPEGCEVVLSYPDSEVKFIYLAYSQ
jgi:hypothetical protein